LGGFSDDASLPLSTFGLLGERCDLSVAPSSALDNREGWDDRDESLEDEEERRSSSRLSR
jgi:hypothetical protein